MSSDCRWNQGAERSRDIITIISKHRNATMRSHMQHEHRNDKRVRCLKCVAAIEAPRRGGNTMGIICGKSKMLLRPT